MRIVVIGMSEVGKHIASVLAAEKHDVTIVDENPERLAGGEEAMDVMALLGYGADIETLKRANAGAADLVVAVSDHDEANLLAGVAAKRLGASRAAARVSLRRHIESAAAGSYSSLLGIDLIISEQVLTAIEVHRLVKTFGAIAAEVFLDNQVEMIQLPVEQDLSFLKKPLHEVHFPENCMVAGILRNGDLIVPRGADFILAGDEVFLIGRIEEIPRLERMFGRTERQGARKVIIVGGGEVGYSVANMLEADPISVILIEKEEQRCRELSNALNRTVVLHGDGTNYALLREERIDNCDVFAAVSGEDETNLMACLLAKKLGAAKTVSLVGKPDYVPIYRELGIDAAVAPRLSAANRILKFVRRGEVTSVSVVGGGKAEVLEIIPSEESLILSKPLKDLSFPRGTLVAAIGGLRGARVPRGSDKVQPGEVVVVFTDPKDRPSVERLFRKRLFSLG